MRLAVHASFRRTVIANGLLIAFAVTPATGAWAQQAAVDAPPAAGADAGAGAGAGSAPTTGGSGQRGFSFVPRLSLQQTFTSNVELNASGRADQITEINPGFNLAANGARLSAYADYTLRDMIYAQHSEKNSTASSLNAFGSWRAIGDWAAIDFRSSISQQAISAFGSSSTDNGLANANLTQTYYTQVSPYIRGQLLGVAEYEARYTWSTTHSANGGTSNGTSSTGLLNLRGETSASRINWTANLTSQHFTYAADGRTTNDQYLRTTLGYAFTPQLTASLIAGRETNNFTSLADETHNTGGWSVNWIPSDRSQVALSRENRFFGEAHSVNMSYRGQRTEWRYSDTRDVSANPNQSGGASVGTLYDLLFSQFASLEPDPIRRADLVNAYLQAYGLSPDAKPVGGFLNSAVTLQRAQNLSFAILGIRDTITFVATQTQTQRLDALSTASDDLANGGTVQQRGFSVSYSHRLTPASSFSVLASHSESTGSSTTTTAATNADTGSRSLYVNFSTRVGQKSTATLSARRVVYDGTGAYSESALVGSLNLQF